MNIKAIALLALVCGICVCNNAPTHSDHAVVLRSVVQTVSDQEGGLDDLIADEVTEGDNLRIEYKQMNAATLFVARIGFFFVEFYAKTMVRLKKMWHTYKTPRYPN